MLISVISLIVVLGILVLLHEGGHFLAARAVKAPVAVFSVGFGRRLFGLERGGTDYRVSLIPLGGYVRVLGLGPDESDVAGAEHENVPLLPRWKRAVVLIAGPIANIIGAILFLAAAYMVGVQVPIWQNDPPVIAWVDPGSPAAHAGIEAGDRVISIDGTRIDTWRDLQMQTLTAANRTLHVVFERSGSRHDATLTPESQTSYALGYAGVAPPIPATVPSVLPGSAAEAAGIKPGDRIVAIDGEPVRHFFDVMRLVGPRPGKRTVVTIERDGKKIDIVTTPHDEAGQGKLGIPPASDMTLERLALPAALRESVNECRRMTVETFSVIGRMLTGRASVKQMSGPIDIARFSGAAAKAGLVPLIWLLGVISLQLAIFNLLPIPVLDGGHLAVLTLETAVRRDFSDKVKERILNIGFWLIVALFVVVLYNDIVKVAKPFLSKILPG